MGPAIPRYAVTVLIVLAAWCAAGWSPQRAIADEPRAEAMHRSSAPATADRASTAAARGTQRWRPDGDANIDREFECLALNIYWEARSESMIGKRAVAHVTLNRARHPRFPRSICDVVFEGQGRGQYQCQFSWACDGRSDRPTHAAAWREARNVAHTVLFQTSADPTGGALWYHATYVSPDWADRRHRIARIGQHVFYNRVRLRHEMPAASAGL